MKTQSLHLVGIAILLLCLDTSQADILQFPTYTAETASYNYSTEDFEFIRLIQKRYYFIRRLEKPVSNLIVLYDQHPVNKNTQLIKRNTYKQFHNPLLRETVRELEKKNDIKPLYKIWNDFLSYKSIEDESYIRETVAVILLLYKQILSSILDSQKYHQLLAQYADKNPAQEFLTLNEEPKKSIDSLSFEAEQHSHNHLPSVTLLLSEAADQPVTVCMEPERTPSFDNEETCMYFKTLIQLLDETQQSFDFITLNNIRFYHIQRLVKPMFFLAELYKKNALAINRELEKLPIVDNAHFKHEHIKTCCAAIRDQQGLFPLFALWQCIVSYRYLTDQSLVSEFITLLIIVYKTYIMPLYRSESERITNSFLQLYENLDAVPLTELLNILDTLVDQLDEVITSYELDDPKLSWKDWFKKYWWLPPIIVAYLLGKYSHFFISASSSHAASPTLGDQLP